MSRLIRWDPFRELVDMRDSFDRLLGRFRTDYASEPAAWMPAVDVVEEGNAFILKADLPGIDKDNIKISISGDTLTISGKTAEEKKEKKGNYLYQERICGSFLRSFTLPALVDRKKVQATYKDGVLQVTLPKAEEAKEREIKVEVA